MKVYNLTDVLENPRPIVVYKQLVLPGEMVEVDEDPIAQQHAQSYVTEKLAAVGSLPSWYALKKDQLRRATKRT